MSDIAPALDSREEKSDTEPDDEISASVDDWKLPICYNERRHLEEIVGDEKIEHTWRLKEKHKTHCVALVLCLNLGVDPPDVVKTQPCARLECWIDPASMSTTKALETVGHALQSQYERWQPRARYKQSLDPTMDEIKKLCCSLRRNAKDERVLFHYNGHGVPRPTTSGEIWVFNKAYTQYIPVTLYELQTWMGAPSLYVYECSNAGVIVESFLRYAEQHRQEDPSLPSYSNCIQLAACGAGQTLPMNADLPADLFTACLTTPVKMALRWFVISRRRPAAAPDALAARLDKIPGQVTDRRTMLGELNWIFTAITDTIAWSSLDSEVFQRLFRADLLTASLCRNFLLAERVMRDYNCTPVSHPALPSTARHPLWAAWEHAVELALCQLGTDEYRGAPFFRDQLTAFCVWLQRPEPGRPPPDQLPMVLQVLLSTLHRVRALQILCRYLALGPGAVRALLHVGIFPYMLKLLQASAQDLRPTMVYIWAKIIAVDPSCQVDLVNAKGHKYFLAVLQDPTVDEEHRTLAAYVLAGIVEGYAGGQDAALQAGMVAVCLEALGGGGDSTRRWAALGLARLWAGQDAARWAGLRDLAHEKLYPLLTGGSVETRAAAARALGALLARHPAPADHALNVHRQVGAALATALAQDASSLVRMEILNALQWLVVTFEPYFVSVAMSVGDGGGAGRVEWGTEVLDRTPPAAAPPPLPTVGFGSVYAKVWSALCEASRDPHPLVSATATELVEVVEGAVAAVRGRRAREPPRAPPLSTEFERWAAGEVARPDPPRAPDPESQDHHDRTWRYTRNQAIRTQAHASARNTGIRLEAMLFYSKCPLPPAVLAFHPYEQHLALASHDNFGIWDWGTGAKLCVGTWRRPVLGRISDVSFLNAHDRSLVCVCSHRGHVCVYRCEGGALADAWRALPGARGEAGALVAWRAATADLLVAGGAPVARYWDLRAERERLTVNTDSEAGVTAVSRAGGVATAGFADGAVRWWDERAPSVTSRRPHSGRVVAARLRPDVHLRVSVCAEGRVVVTDTRTERAVADTAVAGGAAAAGVHPVLGLVAVASSHGVAVKDLAASTLHTIRSYEGFMGTRIGPISCLALHPLRPAVALGAKDCTISVYVPDRR